MTPEERDLIASVFQRLEQVAGAPKDADANTLIGDYMRRQPEATYGLVQAVLVQESALKQAQARIADLEQRLARQGTANTSAAGTGGFLPQSGGNPWVQSAPQPAPAQPVYQAPPAYQQAPQPMAQAQPSPWGQPAAGGFLRNAATAAVGVAGGMLVAEGISSLFSGHHGGFGGGFGNAGYGGPQETVENVTVNNYYGDQQGNTQTAGYDSGYDGGSDASWSGDDSSDDGGDTWM